MPRQKDDHAVAAWWPLRHPDGGIDAPLQVRSSWAASQRRTRSKLAPIAGLAPASFEQPRAIFGGRTPAEMYASMSAQADPLIDRHHGKVVR
jgi:hypothetical protein